MAGAYRNGKWVEFGPDGQPLSGGDQAKGEVYEGKDGKLRYKGTDQLVTGGDAALAPGTPPSRDSFPPGILGEQKYQKAMREFEAAERERRSKAKPASAAAAQMP